MIVGKLDHFFFLTPCTKINLKLIKDLNIRPATIKLLEENRSSNLSDVSLHHIFLDMSPQARETKAKINYRDYIKIKIICTVKEIINKMQRQPTERKKFAKDISIITVKSKIYEELVQH